MTRKTFYVTTDLFERQLSRMAKLVLTYLSRVSDRAGVCFPSVSKIAKNCACCENTVRKAIRELCGAGVLQKEETFADTENGRRRQRANRYTLLLPVSNGGASERQNPPVPPAKNEPTPLQPLNPPPAAVEGEMNHNSKLTMANNTPSVRNAETEGAELEHILKGLHLDLYENRMFAKSVEQAIRTMYRSPYITVKGDRIPQGAVRDLLCMLSIDHIDYVQEQLQNGEDRVVSGERYLISCIYNAPVDSTVNHMQAYG